MSKFNSEHPLGVALVGCGMIALANHVPGIRMCPAAKVVALCDKDASALNRAGAELGVSVLSTEADEIFRRDDVHAVVIATPNRYHAPLVVAAASAGKHVLCEKPLALNYAEAKQMYQAAVEGGVNHMTAFTYRFVPAMHYMKHLVQSGAIGRPYHFRSCRLQDWGTRDLGWRQVKELAGSGELGDMLSHRVDFAHWLLGPMRRLVADTRLVHEKRGGNVSNLEDWVSLLVEFDNGASGVLESSKLATGRGEGGKSQDYCEVNGEEGTLIYHLNRPLEILRGRKGGAELEVEAVPVEFQKWHGSPRNPEVGDPVVTFRYDQSYEFIQSILEGRPCEPSFLDGARAQAVMEAALISVDEKRWVEVKDFQ